MNDFTPVIEAGGGRWWETEVLGDRAIVKVSAPAFTLTNIANTPTFRRIPLQLLGDTLSSLSAAQLNAIANELTDAGYSLAEINQRFPNIANATLGDVLRFLASRRLKPRYDAATDTIILDGPIQPCTPLVDEVDQAVS